MTYEEFERKTEALLNRVSGCVDAMDFVGALNTLEEVHAFVSLAPPDRLTPYLTGKLKCTQSKFQLAQVKIALALSQNEIPLA